MCIDELKILWKNVFRDENEYIDSFFDKMYEKENVLVHQENGKIVAALYMIPYEFRYNNQISKVMYLYALSTDEKYRGKGIMSRMISKSNKIIELEKYAGSFLIPANDKLYGYYNKFGYVDTIMNKKYNEINLNYLKDNYMELLENNFEIIYKLDNDRKISNRIILTRNQYEFYYDTFIKDGGKTFISNDGKEYILAFINEKTVDIYDTNVSDLINEEYVKKGLFRKNTDIFTEKFKIKNLYIGHVLE